jgi:hypothetical protein
MVSSYYHELVPMCLCHSHLCHKLYYITLYYITSKETSSLVLYYIALYYIIIQGESHESLGPCVHNLEKYGVGSILDYAAEADLSEEVGEKMTHDQPAREYRYSDELACDANKLIFLDAIRAVHNVTPEGFAAIKVGLQQTQTNKQTNKHTNKQNTDYQTKLSTIELCAHTKKKWYLYHIYVVNQSTLLMMCYPS